MANGDNFNRKWHTQILGTESYNRHTKAGSDIAMSSDGRIIADADNKEGALYYGVTPGGDDRS